jgi:acetyl esterase/lipase
MRQVFALVLAALCFAPVLAQRPQATANAKAKTKAAAALPDNVVAQRDIEYAKAGDVSLKLDLYQPKAETAKPRPCIVWIHGGGWQGGNKSGGVGRVAPLVATGDYVGASVGYRLTDVAAWPAQIHDCKAAIRYLRANANKLGIDPNKIGVWGSSAGGHLVSLLGTSGDVKEVEGDLGTTGVSSRVSCVVDFCGPSDFLLFGVDSPRLNEPGQPLYKLFGGPLKDHQDAAKQASPVTFVTKDDPPFLIMHGTADNTVSIRQAERLYEAEKQAGMNTTFVKVTGGGHGFGGPEVNARVKAFLDKQLLGKDIAVSAEPIQAQPAEAKAQ